MALSAIALATSMLAALWLAGHGTAVAYVIVYAVAVLPGLPIGFTIFGPRHPAAWIGGALVGYGLTQIAIWFAIASRLSSPWGFGAAWIVLLGAALLVRRTAGSKAGIGLPSWDLADTRALLLVLLLVPMLMAPPYANLGREDAQGNRYYRAYFTADFLWHSALTFELTKFSLPPRNPYMTPRAINYYWTYFLLPAAAAELASNGTPDDTLVHSFLKANALLSGLLMVGALFLVVRTAVPRAGSAALAVALTILAASAEGLYAIVDLVIKGRPLAVLLDTNVDAVTAWYFGGLRIDNIPRSLWYTPQHTTAVALGLIGWFIGISAGARASWAAIAGAGLVLGLATTMNPFLGGCFSLIYGATVAVDALYTQRDWRLLARPALAALPVALAVAWGSMSKMTEGAGSVVAIGFTASSSSSAIATLVLSLGPVLGPALAGYRRMTPAARLPVSVATSGILLGMFLLYFVRISEASWVGFRAGQILLVSIPILLARTLAAATSRIGALVAAAIFVVGVPTTMVDTWNAQDIGNRRPGPGFRWTLWTTPAQQRAFAWIREHTPSTAVVQMEPMVRAREHWTLIPSFAGRRMAAGLPLSLLPLPEYAELSSIVRTIYSTGNAAEASTLARRLHIDYLYVDATDALAYPTGVRSLAEQPSLFELVFLSEDVRIYRVR